MQGHRVRPEQLGIDHGSFHSLGQDRRAPALRGGP
jgi:hypothetical protein